MYKTLVKIYLFQSAVDLSSNTVHVMENRYILQNNLAEFQGINNLKQCFVMQHEYYAK